MSTNSASAFSQLQKQAVSTPTMERLPYQVCNLGPEKIKQVDSYILHMTHMTETLDNFEPELPNHTLKLKQQEQN